MRNDGERLRAGILISGRGSNMAALLEAAKALAYPVEFSVVIANRTDAAGLALACKAGVAALCVPSSDYGDRREAHERVIDEALRAHAVSFVCLAGYMRMLTPFLVTRWQGRILNIHPSLLPAFKGLNTHARVLAAGERRHGCSVHLVTDAVDDGLVLGQAAVDVLRDDTVDTLAARVLEQEHLLYPAVVGTFAKGLALAS